MENAVLMLVFKLTQSALTGVPSLHPPLISPLTLSEEQQHQQLYGDYDRLLQKVPGYQDDIRPLGTFSKPWIMEEEIPSGVLSEYLANAIREFRGIASERAMALYGENVSRFDQAIISLAVRYGTQAHSYLMRKKTDILGRFPDEQDHFFYLLKSDNLNALLYSYQMTHFAFDRLRGYRIRQSALGTSLISPQDKAKIQTVMDPYLTQHKRELNFWGESCISLRTLYDVLLHIVDGQRVLLYQQKTGFEKQLIRFKVEEMIKKALYAELIASFFNHSYQQRNPGFISRGVEYVLNTVGSWYANEIGAKDPRPFPELLAHAITETQADYETLSPYAENPPFAGKDKAAEFFEAIMKDHLALAMQIALNGSLANNNDLNWHEELRKLKGYRELLKSLFVAQDEFFKLKYWAAHKLSDTANPALESEFEELDKAEYDAQQVRIELMVSYQKEILEQLNKPHHLWGALKKRLKDHVTHYLMKNKVYEQTPPFQVCSEKVRGRIAEYVRHISRVQMDPTDVMLTPERNIGLISHQAFSRFHSAEDYSTYVTNPQFGQVTCIEAAIEFCQQNMDEKNAGWNWEKEKKELEIYRRFVAHLEVLSNTQNLATVAAVEQPANPGIIPAKPTLSKGRITEIRKQLIESYRKKVDTDYSKTVRAACQTLGETAKNMLYLVGKSVHRKYTRGAIGNTARDFRDPDFLPSFALELKLELEFVPMPLQPGLPPPNDQEDWILADTQEGKEGDFS